MMLPSSRGEQYLPIRIRNTAMAHFVLRRTVLATAIKSIVLEVLAPVTPFPALFPSSNTHLRTAHSFLAPIFIAIERVLPAASKIVTTLRLKFRCRNLNAWPYRHPTQQEPSALEL
jgi:hypothetical protein